MTCLWPYWIICGLIFLIIGSPDDKPVIKLTPEAGTLP